MERLALLLWPPRSWVGAAGWVVVEVVRVFGGRVGADSRRALGSPADGGGWWCAGGGRWGEGTGILEIEEVHVASGGLCTCREGAGLGRRSAS